MFDDFPCGYCNDDSKFVKWISGTGILICQDCFDELDYDEKKNWMTIKEYSKLVMD